MLHEVTRRPLTLGVLSKDQLGGVLPLIKTEAKGEPGRAFFSGLLRQAEGRLRVIRDVEMIMGGR